MAISKKEFYKIYLGSEQQSNPQDWTIHSAVHRKHLKKAVINLVQNAKKGVEIYILTPDGEVKAYYRDKLEKFFS